MKSSVRVAITTLGCKINQFESASLGERIAATGYAIVPFSEPADIYIVNTCSVTARTDAESRQLIRRASRLNPDARIVVTGCYAQIARDELASLPGVSLVCGNAEKRGLEHLLEELGRNARVLVSETPAGGEEERLPLQSFAEHTRAFLQVQNGCNDFCSYCIVPYARGRSRSVPPAEVLAGIRSFLQRDYREIVLTGIHLGAYGLDLNPRASLTGLLSQVERETPVQRLRLGSVEPVEIDDDLVALFGNSSVICPHLHVPLQSGSDTVLHRMNRKYGSGFFTGRIERLTAASPYICIGADLIAGFPGETELEFAETCRLLESLPLAYLHVFPFSPRPGTPAAIMPDSVPAATIKERARILRELSDRKRSAYLQRFVGSELQVLFLAKKTGGGIKGLSRNYLPVVVPGGKELVNRELRVRIDRIDGGNLIGSPT